MDFYGKVMNIFIPGWCDANGKTGVHMDARFVAFELDIFVYENEQKIENPTLPKEMLILERGTWEIASIYVNDWFKIPFSVIKGYDQWEGYNKVFLNLSTAPCVTKTA